MTNTTRRDLIHAANKRTGKEVIQCQLVFSAMLKVIADYLANGDSIMIHGAFTMTPVRRKYRPGLNPKTLEFVPIPEHMNVKTTFHMGIK